MAIILLIYALFLIVYIAFNIYGISRLSSMRIKGDATGTAIFVYLLTIAIIIGVSIFFISFLKWPIGFKI